MVKSAKESIKQKASSSEIYGNMQAVFIEMDSSHVVSPLVKCCLKSISLPHILHFWPNKPSTMSVSFAADCSS